MNVGAKLPGTIEPMHVWHGEGGVRIAGDSWGDPAGPLVILQHGGGQTRHAWKGAGERLGAAGYHAVVLDARGHGNSDWAPDGRYDQDVMIGDVKRVIEVLGGRKPMLVGASMGGANSLVAVGEGTINAAALVLVDVAARIEREGADRILAFMTGQPEGFNSLEEAAEAIASYQPHRKRPKTSTGSPRTCVWMATANSAGIGTRNSRALLKISINDSCATRRVPAVSRCRRWWYMAGFRTS